ncbi:hypothetical protein NA57DRAFT_45233 [Rhizodiscina lignyota]|uniref:Amino acid transporter transmembrane domain-containing protein n=1 Tax=Rhizodiscina lignyota TaxID=1504668 RepID=A0A9P4I744_9PEZI|nr:hypothetical protein NA57DRAFT_45233 [Rhizodiscina lignyota]
MNVPGGGKQPTTWEEYERGGRSSSFGSEGSHIQWDEVERNTSATSGRSHLGVRQDGQDQDLRRRRSSMSVRLSALAQAGGPNSIDNFARSWQRAAGFFEITPVRPSFRVQTDDEGEGDEAEYRQSDIEESPVSQRSLLRAAFEARRPSENVIEESNGAEEDTHLSPGARDDRAVSQRLLERQRSRDESIFQIEPSLASPFGGSYGTMYGSLASRVNESSMRHAGRLFTEQQMKGVSEPDKEREPLLVRQIEEDGVKYNIVVGQSTVPQTVFNSVNVLIGVGLLSLPLALRYSGWVIGMIFFLFSALGTQYTAKVLAKCLDVDSSLITFADLAFVSFGHSARVVTSIIFTIELVGANVALVVLFADSLDALIPGLDLLAWKLICGVILVPLSFLPLRLLSFTSIVGILCCFGIVLAVFVDGFIKPHQPGSLREPAKTYLFPENWGTVPLSFGLLMSPWGGHSVFPNIYRDMRHPNKYHRSVNITYVFTYLIDLAMAVAGLLMFGNLIRDEVTANILLTDGYPKWLSIFIVVCVAIIPITKVPLNARPIVSTIEIILGLDARTLATAAPSLVGISGLNRGIIKFFVRVLTVVVFIAIAVVFPSFDRIMTLLGSVCCFSICIILPLAFHLKLFGKELGNFEYWGNWVMMVISAVMGVVSTVFAFFPKEMIGA